MLIEAAKKRVTKLHFQFDRIEYFPQCCGIDVITKLAMLKSSRDDIISSTKILNGENGNACYSRVPGMLLLTVSKQQNRYAASMIKELKTKYKFSILATFKNPRSGGHTITLMGKVVNQ